MSMLCSRCTMAICIPAFAGLLTACADGPRTAAPMIGDAAALGEPYRPVAWSVTPAIPPYALPVKAADVANLSEVSERLPMAGAAARLGRNGFAVVRFGDCPDWMQCTDFADAYELLRHREVPVFVTSDSMLHMYHVQFDETLMAVELTSLADDLLTMLTAVEEDLLRRYATAAGGWREATGLALGAVSVPRRLLLDARLTRQFYKPLRDALAAEDWNGADGWLRQYRLSQAHAEQWSRLMDRFFSQRRDGPPPVEFEPRRKALLALLDAMMAGLPHERNAARPLPAEVERKVAAELELIAAHDGSAESPLLGYAMDYTQFIPRGHYTRREVLGRYFRAMVWLGRATFLLRGRGEPGATGKEPVDAAAARLQTRAAAVLAATLAEARAGERPVAAIWQRMYAITAFYVGLCDDLSWTDYAAALHAELGERIDLAKLDDEATFARFRGRLAALRGPAVYDGTGRQVVLDPTFVAGIPDAAVLEQLLGGVAGMRLMGQRLVPDSYLMGRLVMPVVGEWRGGPLAFSTGDTPVGPRRVFARGLDVFAAFGSGRARQLLAATRDDRYAGYDEAMAAMQKQFAGLDVAAWNRNLYWGWLYAVRGLLADCGKGYQSFQQTPAWQTRQLHAACASWSQLRHDTILYVKESSCDLCGGTPEPRPVPGYVEPAPEFYARLLALSRTTREGLDKLAALDEDTRKRLAALEGLCRQLLDISLSELADKPLTAEQYKFIKDFDEELIELSSRQKPEDVEWWSEDFEPERTDLIADVMTDPNSEQCLEEATGPVDWLYVIYRLPDGRLGVGVGPTLSYFEFKQPASGRLTDEQWRKMLADEPQRPRPDWAAEIFAPAAPAGTGGGK